MKYKWRKLFHYFSNPRKLQVTAYTSTDEAIGEKSVPTIRNSVKEIYPQKLAVHKGDGRGW